MAIDWDGKRSGTITWTNKTKIVLPPPTLPRKFWHSVFARPPEPSIQRGLFVSSPQSWKLICATIIDLSLTSLAPLKEGVGVQLWWEGQRSVYPKEGVRVTTRWWQPRRGAGRTQDLHRRSRNAPSDLLVKSGLGKRESNWQLAIAPNSTIQRTFLGFAVRFRRRKVVSPLMNESSSLRGKVPMNNVARTEGGFVGSRGDLDLFGMFFVEFFFRIWIWASFSFFLSCKVTTHTLYVCVFVLFRFLLSFYWLEWSFIKHFLIIIIVI